MPQLEQGDLATVARSASKVAAALGPRIDEGCDVIALVPSCALMLKSEWPLILPNDPAIAKLSAATFDISEYIVNIARKEGLASGLSPLGGGVPFLRMSARRNAYPSRDGDRRERRDAARTPNRTRCPRLRDPRNLVRRRNEDSMIGTASARSKRRLTCEDILPLAEYAATRKWHRARIAEVKRRRRVKVPLLKNEWVS
jgi:hypothetical protein